jgi:hypothetical protein
MTRRIVPVPGFTPAIGRMVAMLARAREVLLAAVEGLSTAELDHLHDARSNSIGALLAHAAAVERWHQLLVFEDRPSPDDDLQAWLPALDLGDEGRKRLRDRNLADYLHDLAEGRRLTLHHLAGRDDAWFEAPLPAAPDLNAHGAWFHVMEDEIGHCGQIRWLRARLPDTRKA